MRSLSNRNPIRGNNRPEVFFKVTQSQNKDVPWFLYSPFDSADLSVNSNCNSHGFAAQDLQEHRHGFRCRSYYDLKRFSLAYFDDFLENADDLAAGLRPEQPNKCVKSVPIGFASPNRGPKF